MKITEQYQNRSSLEAWEVFIYFDLIAHRSLLYLCVTQQLAFGIIYTWISVGYLWEFHANLLVFFDVIYYRVNFFFFFFAVAKFPNCQHVAKIKSRKNLLDKLLVQDGSSPHTVYLSTGPGLLAAKYYLV